MPRQTFTSEYPFALESGEQLPGLEIAYHTYGELNSDASNVVWVCHALTANSDAADWWSGLVGEGKAIDPGKYFIVCANILASCYGSSGPLTINPRTGEPYYSTFPHVTIRDMVNAHILLRRHLGIKQIRLCIGGSMGGYQVLEWAVMEPGVINSIGLIATGARESAWGISIHTAQRIAIEADPSWKEMRAGAGAAGLKAARAIGMLTYRSYEAFGATQTDDDDSKLDDFKASSYIHHQGDKLVKRFNVHSYWLLTKSMDSHNLARRRARLEDVLFALKMPALVVGISSDFLCPLAEQQFLAKHIPGAQFHEIDSPYGHDGFLIEWEKLGRLVSDFLD
jgi:homoserine O-acetyltransferase/O-succinyltransferase